MKKTLTQRKDVYFYEVCDSVRNGTFNKDDDTDSENNNKEFKESTRINYHIVLEFYIILTKAIRSLTIILSEEDRLCDEMTA